MANTTGLGDTIYAAVKKALEDAEGSGGSSGGGGSSDFTTATVTVVPSGETTNAQLSYLGVCTTAELQGQTFAASKPMSPDLYFDVILYNGASMLNVKAGANFSIVSTSGAIQQMNAMTYMITGDCTITVS